MNKPDIMRATLALLLLLSFQAALGALFKFQVPQTNRDMVIYMLGQLSGMVTTALAFYFATSKSSHDKNALIADAMPTGQPKPVEVVNGGDNPVPVTAEPLDLTGAELPDDRR